jgi:hypothetical protein
MLTHLHDKQMKEVLAEYKKNHGKSQGMVHHMVNELATRQADLQVQAIENIARSEELKQVSANEELALLLANNGNQLETHYESAFKIAQDRAVETARIANKFMDDYSSDMQSILSINAQLILEVKQNSSDHRLSSSSLTSEHPLEQVYKEKLDKLKSRVCLLMSANLDLGQKLMDSLVAEKDLKRELEDLKKKSSKSKEIESNREEKRDLHRKQYEAELRAPETVSLCEKLISLQKKIDEAEQTLKLKQSEVEKLDKRGEDLSKNISELMAFESQIGYDKLKDVSKQYKRSVKDFDELERRNHDLESLINALKTDQRSKQSIIEKISKESKLLLFLNFKLIEEMNEFNPSSAVHKYSREYFRRKKMLQEDEDILLSLEEVYDSESHVKASNAELHLRLVDMDTQLKRKDHELHSRDAKLQALTRELEIYKNRNIMVENKVEKKTGDFDELIETLNSSIVSDENIKLKADVRKLVDMNNSLNLVLVDKDIQIASQQKLISSLKREIEDISQSYKTTTEELMLIRNSDFKILQTEKDLLKADLQASNKMVTLLRDRIASMTSGIHKVRELCSREEIRPVASISPLVARLIEEIKTHLSQSQPAPQLDIEDVLSRLWNEKEQVMVFKIEALMAYNGILENKCRGLEKALSEYFSKIEDLERERASLEANTALEKLKTFMANKEEEINSMTARLEELIGQQEDNRKQEKHQWSNLVKDVEAVGTDGKSRLLELEKEMQAKVDQIIEKCRLEVHGLSSKSDEILAEKEKELTALRDRLEGIEFEGRAEMVGQLETLLSQNFQLRREVAQLEAANRIHEINVGAVEEINDSNLKIVQLQTSDQVSKLDKAVGDLRSQLEKQKKEAVESEKHLKERCEAFERRAGQYSDCCSQLLAGLKNLPASEELQTVISGAESRINEITS